MESGKIGPYPFLKAILAIGTARFKFFFSHGTWNSIHDSSMIHGFPYIAHVMGRHAMASHESWMNHGWRAMA